MRTVLLATGETDCMKALGETYPVPLLPLIDRPFVQHVVEFLAGQDIRDFDIVLSHLPQQVESLLGDGSRWGCRIRYHLVRDLSQVGRVVKTIADNADEPFLLADATKLPQIDVRAVSKEDLGKGPVFYCSEDRESLSYDSSTRWTGWCILPQYAARMLPALYQWEELFPWALVRYRKRCTVIKPASVLKIDTYTGILDAHRQVLDKKFSGLLLTGTEVEENIWLSRNVEMHPTARVEGPAFIGPNCRIGKGVQLGPYAVIGRNCVLDDHSSISHAVIFPNTYVGEALELTDVITDKNRLINERYSSEVTITDDFILSNIRQSKVRKWLSGFFSRAFAAFLLCFSLPLLPFMYLHLKKKRSGQVFYRKQVVKLPAEYDPALWETYSLTSFVPFEKETLTDSDENSISSDDPEHDILVHFFLTVLPGLMNVVRGDLQVIGVQPRSKEEISHLEDDWSVLYLKSKAGLITESFINFGPHALPDEVYSAEMLYSGSFTRKKDLILLGRYFGRLIKALCFRKAAKR